MFLVIEGIDGSGKTTLVNSLAEALNKEGISTATLGAWDSEHGPAFRKLLTETELPGVAQLMVACAARTLIQPEIEQLLGTHEVVIMDRYFLSTLAYQTYRATPEVEAFVKHQVITHLGMNMWRNPDLTLLLDAFPEDALARVSSRGDKDVLERKGEALMEHCISVFGEALTSENSVVTNIRVIPARNNEQDLVLQKALGYVKEMLDKA